MGGTRFLIQRFQISVAISTFQLRFQDVATSIDSRVSLLSMLQAFILDADPSRLVL